MAKKRRDKQATRNAQWEAEVAVFREFREDAAEKKARARRNGYKLSFFDYLDSFTEEFVHIGVRAKTEFAPYLYDVVETNEEMVVRDSWTEFGIPPGWKPVVYHVEEQHQSDTQDKGPPRRRRPSELSTRSARPKVNSGFSC